MNSKYVNRLTATLMANVGLFTKPLDQKWVSCKPSQFLVDPLLKYIKECSYQGYQEQY